MHRSSARQREPTDVIRRAGEAGTRPAAAPAALALASMLASVVIALEAAV
jgi:hypothetical protein